MEDSDSPGALSSGASRYKKLADGLGGFMIEVRPTEAVDQGDWKCVATSEEGVIAITTCHVEMSSKIFSRFSQTHYVALAKIDLIFNMVSVLLHAVSCRYINRFSWRYVSLPLTEFDVCEFHLDIIATCY